MQQSFKTKNLIKFAAIIFISSALLVSCNNTETKTTDAVSDTVEVKQDSLPPLNDDSTNTTRPETIKNTTGVQPAN